MNVGLIGCGGVAHGHMQAYLHMTNANVVAVADIDSGKAKIFAKKYKIKKSFSDYRNLLEIKDLDFVDICTPTSTHAPLVCDAAKFGQNILVEKPMARNTDECDRMLLESKRRAVKLCVCHNQIFLPFVRKAKSLVDSGSYDLVSFRTTVKERPEMFGAPLWNVTPEEKGVLWEAGCHPAYLQLHFLKDITDVYAFGYKVRYPVYDHFAALLRTPNRTFGIMELSWLANEAEMIHEIGSSDGKRAQIDIYHGTFAEKTGKSESSPDFWLWSDIQKGIHEFRRHLIPSPKTLKGELGYFIGHYHLISEYIRNIRNDKPPPVPPEEGKKAIRLLEYIEKSLDTQQVVPTK